MRNLNAFLIAAAATLAIAGCSGTSNNTDSGTTNTDSGSMMMTDAGNHPDAGSGNTDAGPNCMGTGGCYSCPPTTYQQIINACTTAQSVTKTPTGLPLLPDGGLPALP